MAVTNNPLKPHWRVVEFTVRDLADTDPKRTENVLLGMGSDYVKFTRPSYQRSIKWTEARAREFRRSLAKGYPIGVVVLADDGIQTMHGTTLRYHNYRIIDGQQRLYWLKTMRDNFFAEAWFLDRDQMDSELSGIFTDLYQSMREGPSEDEVSMPELQQFVREVSANVSAGTEFRSLLNAAIQASSAEAIPADPDGNDRRVTLASEALVVLKTRKQQFEDMSIFALVIEPELRSELPDVFVKLNSGVRLSSTDIFAADWATYTVDLDQALERGSTFLTGQVVDSLKELSRSRLVDADLDDEGYEVDEGDTSGLSLYEYLYALSAYVCQLYPSTFGSVKKASSELALNVAALLFTGSISNLQKLPQHFARDHFGELDTDTFPTALLKAANVVDSELNPVIGWDLGEGWTRTNPLKSRSLASAFGLTQAATYLAAYIANVYAVEDQKVGLKAGAARRGANFRRAVRSWYLADALRPLDGSDARRRSAERVWSDHGEWEPNTQMLAPVPLDRLARDYQAHTLESLEVAKTPERRRLSGSENCAILRLAYTNLRAYEGSDKDHVIPIRKCEGLINAPLNHFANWMPLSPAENRSRQDRLWADCWPDSGFDANRNEIRRNLVLPYEDVNDSVVASTEALKEFLKKRAGALAVPLLRAMQHPDVENEVEAAQQFSTD